MYLTVEENGEPVAASLLEIHRSRLSTFAIIHDGPLCDLHDKELTRFFITKLAELAKSKGATQLDISPENIYRLRDSYGAVLPGEPADDEIELLKSLGFEHTGFDVGYSAVPRWRYLKDLTAFQTPDQLLASYSKNTRRNVKIAANSGVEVRSLKREELDMFHGICGMSSRKQHFENRPLEYFQAFYDNFGERAEFMVAEVHLDQYLQSWQSKLEKFEHDLARLEKSLETTKYPDDVKKKLAVARKNVTSAHRRIDDANERIACDGEIVPVSVGLFVWHKRELVYLFSGSDERYAKFYAPTALQHEMMSECLRRGVDRYNFYGISGVFDDPNDSGRGVLEFKQGFNGYVEELMGEFVLPVRPVMFRAKTMLRKLLGR